MSFEDSIKRAEYSHREAMEALATQTEFQKQLDKFFQARTNNFCLENNNQMVIEAYHRMIKPLNE